MKNEQDMKAQDMVERSVKRPYLNPRIGDPVKVPVGKGMLFSSGMERWYGLLVVPQAEARAERWLHQRGVYAFHPVKYHQRRRYGRVVTSARRFLPGYVFARFGGDPLPDEVFAGPYITDAMRLRISGEWGILKPSDLRDLHNMRAVDDALEQERRIRAEVEVEAKKLVVGDRVRFDSGPFVGQEGEVIELCADGGTKVRFDLFGRDQIIPVAPGSVGRVVP